METTKVVKSVSFGTTPSYPATESGGSKPKSAYSESDIAGFKKKDLWIARQCAEKCAVGMVDSIARVLASSGRAQDVESVIARLTSERQAFYQSILAEITKDGVRDDSEIPF